MPDQKNTQKNFKRHGSRYKARRRAADLLYEAEVRDQDPVALVAERVDLARDQENQVAPVAEYTKEIVAGVAAELDHLDMLIATHLAEDWELSRITAVDRAVLRVGLWELLWNPEVPIATAVADAVEVASQYSTDASPSYINALLDAIAQNIEQERDHALHQEEYAAAQQEASEAAVADSEQATAADASASDLHAALDAALELDDAVAPAADDVAGDAASDVADTPPWELPEDSETA